MFRPVGAFIFGLMADRYGRRIPMMVDLVFYSAVEVATGFAPNLATFLVLRALFGIGMGGEWGVGTSLVMEKVPAEVARRAERPPPGRLRRRIPAGGGGRVFHARPLRMAAAVLARRRPALLALFIRFAVKESDVWQKTKAESWSQLGRGIASHWKLWIYLTLLMAMMNFSSHGTQDMYPTFMKQFRGLDAKAYSQVVIVMMIGAIVGGIAFGLASDRFGRRRMMIVALLGALAVVPLWAFSSSMGLIVAGAFLMQFMVQGAWGIIPAHISELSPDQVRGFLPGFSYQCGNLIAASIALGPGRAGRAIRLPVRHGRQRGGDLRLAIVATALGRERRGIVFGG